MNHNSLYCTVAEFAPLSAEILRLGKSIRFRARGASMHPLVRHGDVLRIQPVDASKIHLGDVVLCSAQATSLVVHRVLARRFSTEGYQFLIQGDQAAQPDGWFSNAHIYGKLTGLERNGKKMYMNRPIMRALGLIAALRSRWGVGRKGLSLVTLRLFKSLPIFYGYLY